MARRPVLSDEELQALLAQEDGGSSDDGQQLFSPTDFADFCERVAPRLLDPFAGLAPLIDASLELREPELALIGPSAVGSAGGGSAVLAPVCVLAAAPDAVLEVPGVLARRLALAMIGGEDDGAEEVEDVHLASLAELVRQYRLQLTRALGLPAPAAPAAAEGRGHRPVRGGTPAAERLLTSVFGTVDHLVALSARCRLGGQDAGSVRLILGVAAARGLLGASYSTHQAAPAPDRAPSPAPPAAPSSPTSLSSPPPSSPLLHLEARLGRFRLEARELASLAPGLVVRLDRPAGEDVDLVLNGRVVGRGEVTVVGDHYAVRLSALVAEGDREG